MRFNATISLLTLLCTSSSYGFSHPAFLDRSVQPGSGSNSAIGSTSTMIEVDTNPIAGMRPGTSGLRKKVEVWQALDDENKNYVENFIQSLIDTAKESNNGKQLDT